MTPAPTNPTSLEGTTALVTGASRGLGCEIACALAAAGARVVVHGRDEARLAGTVDRIVAAGGNATAIVFDVSDAAEVDAKAAAVTADVGPLDLLINNAGVALHKPAVETTPEEWQRVVDTNLTGTFNCCRAFGRPMLERGRGKVVNISSDLGIRGGEGWAAYSASKGAIIALSKTLAWEWAPAVTVNVLAPGAFATDINRDLLAQPGVQEAVEAATPLGRLGATAEIGPIAVFLASAGSDFMTGAVVPFDGGIRRS